MPFDERPELRSADLASWKDDYLANMADAVQARQNQRATYTAKKNTAHLVTGIGLGGSGLPIGSSKSVNPLGMFAGDNLMQMLTGNVPIAGQKRDREQSSGDEADSEARRRRLQPEGDVGRGDNMLLLDDDMEMQMGSVSRMPIVRSGVSRQLMQT